MQKRGIHTFTSPSNTKQARMIWREMIHRDTQQKKKGGRQAETGQSAAGHNKLKRENEGAHRRRKSSSARRFTAQYHEGGREGDSGRKGQVCVCVTERNREREKKKKKRSKRIWRGRKHEKTERIRMTGGWRRTIGHER